MLRLALTCSLAVFLPACGTRDAGDPSADSSGTAVAPDFSKVPRPVVDGDTLIDLVSLRCGDGRVVSASYYTGAPPTVNLTLPDTSLRLPQVTAASGARYASADASLVWWNKGDSATLTARGRTTECGRDSAVEF